MASRLPRDPITGEILPPPRSARRGGYATKGNRRRRSSKYYLAKGEALLEAVEAGQIAPRTGVMLIGAVAKLNEMFLGQKMLEMQGQDQAIDVTPDPSEGDPRPRLAPHRQKSVTVRRGVDRHGNQIDDKTVKVESSLADDEGVEGLAELEALS